VVKIVYIFFFGSYIFAYLCTLYTKRKRRCSVTTSYSDWLWNVIYRLSIIRLSKGTKNSFELWNLLRNSHCV